MGVRGIDISEWQSTMDVERVARDNQIEFGFVRTNYGANHDDLYFHRHADALERAGAIVLPYVYPLASDIRGSIDDAVRIIAGRYKSCIVDWEHGSGGGAELRLAHELLWGRGFSTPVVYDPKWYWESVGSPDVSWMRGRVKGHWKSWYADNVPKSYNAALAQVPGYVWQDNRGGIPTVIVQFTGTGRLSGYGGNLDLNYFPGTRAELAALLGGQEEDVVTPEDKAEIINGVVNALLTRRIRRSNDPDEPPMSGEFELAWLFAASDGHTSALKDALRKLDVKVDAGFAMLSDDEAKIVAAVRNGGVDPAALAAALAPYMPEGGASPEQVEQALRNVFRTGTEGEA